MSMNVIDLSKSFGATRALVDVSLTLEAGSVEALIGENGAGKSTLIKILSGVQAADAGRIAFDGKPVSLDTPDDARRVGVAVVHQSPQWVDALGVIDNLFMGRADFSSLGGWVDKAALQERARQVFDRYGFRVPLGGLARDLTPAARTLLALTRCLLEAPRVLVLDEPTASLGQAEVDLLKGVVHRLVATGCAVLFVSHRLDEVLSLAQHVTVMRNGRVVARVAAASQTRDSLIAHMSGETSANGTGETNGRDAPAAADRVDVPILEVDSLTTADGRVDAVSLSVQRGQVVVLYGLAGAGRTELLEGVYGLRPRRSGTVRVRGEALDGSVRQALRRGVRLVPEDRKGQALVMGASVRDNLHLGQLRRFARGGVVDAAREAGHALRAMSRFVIRASGPMQRLADLSGGNQQKVVFARTVGGTAPAPATLLLCDEPTQAVDVGTRRAIHALIRSHGDAGGAALVATSDIEELMTLADRVVVMCEGRIVSRFDRRPFPRDAILHACFPAERSAATAR